MQTVYDLASLRERIADWRKQGLTIAFVPTMGNLHKGHISLLEYADQHADKTVVSIFVNPIQFGKGEDYERYPSTLTEDSEKLIKKNTALLFVPDLEQLYPGGLDADTRVTVPELSNILCGQFRPVHFAGVATVVTKLLINVQPNIALFGEKDYQQLLVIKRMVRDLCMPIEIVGVPIMREKDGLAMSSRNQYLSEEERLKAPLIYQTLLKLADKIKQTPDRIIEFEKVGIKELESAGFRPEYLSVRRSEDLAEPGLEDTQLSILVAAWLGNARLIDNIQIELDP